MDPEAQIDEYIAGLSGWKRELVTDLRTLVHDAVPDVREEWKWSTPVFASGGPVCAIGAFADHVKLNFFKGASLPDPHGLFNAGLDAKASRAIDLHEGDAVDRPALADLLGAAVARNRA